jgi:transcriptional regulator of acetoin/glycerol metabolism
MDLEEFHAAWKEFVNNKNILPSVSPMVANSWQRCRSHINPDQKLQFNKLNPDHLLAADVASFDLISIARPIMEAVYQNLDHSNTVIVLGNGAGYILDMLTEPGSVERDENLANMLGVLFTETHVGTNALGLALIERKPVQVIGAEHYCSQFHQIAGAAAPIFDMTGRVLGVIGMLSSLSSYQTASLGIVTAGARAIQAQKHADVLLAEYNSQLAQLNAILDTISEGIVVWNSDRVLVHINTYATKLINKPSHFLIGQTMDTFFSSSALIKRAIENRKPLTDVEAKINIGGRTIDCVLSLRFVLNKTDLMWIIVNFRPVKEVHQLVQRQVGAQANLTLNDIPCESHQMKRIHNQVRSAAAAKASILIRGESGTGKNVLASAIHNESLQRDGPFLRFPCASVPNEFVLSELLGYEEGFGFNYSESRPSKFELAHGGSLFFQDVEYLPLEAQNILLDVLEMGLVQRVGSEFPVQIDVRILAASSANIEKLIDQGSFRADLYYRLSTFTINLPPLREHSRDIPVLVERVLKRISGKFGQPLSLDPGAMDLLKRYSWPGNIRELEAVLSRAATQVDSTGVIGLPHLPVTLRFPKSLLHKNLMINAINPLSKMERDAILQTALQFDGNVTQMAQALGISRTTLWRRLKRYEILPDDYRHHDQPRNLPAH